MDAKRGKHSIQTRLIVLLVVVLVPIMGLQVWVYYDRYRTLYDHELQANLEMARAAGEMFKGLVNAVLLQEAALGITLTLPQALSVEEMNHILTKSKSEAPYIRNFLWLNPNGVTVASDLSQAIGVNFSDRPYFSEIARGRDWSIGDLTIGRITGRHVFAIAKAVRDNAGVMQGVIIATIDDEHLDQGLALNRSQGGAIAIMDSKGMLVYRFPKIEVTWEERNWLKTYPHVQQALDGKEYVATVFAPYENKTRVIANVPLSFGWVAGAGRTESEITGPIGAEIGKQAFLFFAVMVAGLIGATAITRQIGKHVYALREKSYAIGRGEYVEQTQTLHSREFQELSDAFNLMAEKVRLREAELQKANEELERKVSERTADLSRKVDELRKANEQLDDRASQLKALAGKLTMAEQAERRRLSKMLHDGLQQHLVSAKMMLGGLAEQIDSVDLKQAVDEIEKMMGESVIMSRSLSAEISPPVLYEGSLSDGLEWLARWMSDKHHVSVDLTIAARSELHQDVKVLVFESVRELLFNTVKHAKVCKARVSLEQENGARLRITVSDEGAGFDPDRLTSARGDVGFGLFSIRERIGLIGGSVEIDSAPGKGSCFILVVPALQRSTVPLSASDRTSFASSGKEQMFTDSGAVIRVLLADDHTLFRDGLAQMLKKEPDIKVVGHAKDGQEAVNMAAKLKPDVILMDISMPIVNGIEATRIIHREHPNIRIIGLSMYDDQERAQALRDAGASDYIDKGCAASALISAIRDCLLPQ